MNLERLRLTMAMKTPEDCMFNFDPKTIDWDEYLVFSSICASEAYSQFDACFFTFSL
jgi:hypothetical protein